MHIGSVKSEVPILVSDSEWGVVLLRPTQMVGMVTKYSNYRTLWTDAISSRRLSLVVLERLTIS